MENLRRRPVHRRRRKKASSTARRTCPKKPFTAEDIRFTQSKDGKTLYAIVLEIPKDGKVTIKSLASQFARTGRAKSAASGWSAALVDKLKFTRDETGLHVSLPEKFDGKIAFALKIRA